MQRSIFVLVLVAFDFCKGWAFTDLSYPPDMSIEDYQEEFGEEMSPEDLDARFSLIYPGTKWCGPGSVADGYDDLGSSMKADSCCRDHDNCPDIIEAGETKHNLTNDAPYTRLHCDCDEKFRQCLLDSNTTTANRVGTVYFNLIGTKCYREDYPVTGCEKKSGWFHGKCIKYSYNTSEQKRYQWFDVPFYRNSTRRLRRRPAAAV